MVEDVPYYSVVILKKNQAYWFIIKLKTTGLYLIVKKILIFVNFI